MPDLRAQLNTALKGRVCLVGIGNVERGDDGFGVRLAEALAPVGQTSPRISVVIADTSPELWVNRLSHDLFDHVIFLDAVHFSGAPGSVVWLNAGEIWARFPQVSTHKLSLSLLAGIVESNHHSRAWLLGVQPLSLKPGAALSEPVQTTLVLLRDLLASLIVPQSRNALDVWQARMPAVEMENLKP